MLATGSGEDDEGECPEVEAELEVEGDHGDHVTHHCQGTQTNPSNDQQPLPEFLLNPALFILLSVWILMVKVPRVMTVSCKLRVILEGKLLECMAATTKVLSIKLTGIRPLNLMIPDGCR